MKIRLSQLRRIIREVVEATVADDAEVDVTVDEAEDLNKDGKNDFEDVMIARHKASGMPHDKAVEKGEKAAKSAKKKNESVIRKFQRIAESHARITQEEIDAWKSGDWGFVSEHDGGFRNPRRSLDVVPADPAKLVNYIIRNFEGMLPELGCSDVSDPEFKEYVSDALAGAVGTVALNRALAML